jgi:hypothetical protein
LGLPARGQELAERCCCHAAKAALHSVGQAQNIHAMSFEAQVVAVSVMNAYA